jgi:hypothetical protein
MMSKTRREFMEQFKREAVGLLESSGRPLDTSKNLLRKPLRKSQAVDVA